MKKQNWIVLLFVLFGLMNLNACRYLPDQRAAAGGAGNPLPASEGDATPALSLFLSWEKAMGDVASYSVFYTLDQKKNMDGIEIEKMTAPEGEELKSEINLSKSKIAGQISSGATVCFYVIAEGSEGKSDPSDPVCGLF